MAPRHVSDGQSGFQKIMVGAYSAILIVAADADGVPDKIVNHITKGDWTDEERHLLAAFVTPAEINAARLEAALRKIGAPVSETTKHEARASLLRGMIEVQHRAELFHHSLIETSGNQLAGPDFANHVMAVRGEGRKSLFLELCSKQETSGDYKRWGKPG